MKVGHLNDGSPFLFGAEVRSQKAEVRRLKAEG